MQIEKEYYNNQALLEQDKMQQQEQDQEQGQEFE